jgi:hypothetical protein
MNSDAVTVDALAYLMSTSTFLSMLVETVDRMNESSGEQDMKKFCHNLDLLAFAIAVDSSRFEEETDGRVLPAECKELARSIFWLTLRALQSITTIVTEVRKNKVLEPHVEESLNSAKSVIWMVQERLESAAGRARATITTRAA